MPGHHEEESHRPEGKAAEYAAEDGDVFSDVKPLEDAVVDELAVLPDDNHMKAFLALLFHASPCVAVTPLARGAPANEGTLPSVVGRVKSPQTLVVPAFDGSRIPLGAGLPCGGSQEPL